MYKKKNREKQERKSKSVWKPIASDSDKGCSGIDPHFYPILVRDTRGIECACQLQLKPF